MKEKKTLFNDYLNKKRGNGIRIKSLLIKDYSQNQETIICNYNFIGLKKGKEEDYPFETIIIGSNGTGKSTILRYLTEIFYYVQNKKGRVLQHSYYEIVYLINLDLAKIVINNKKVFLYMNEKEVKSIDQFILPERIMALSYMVNDKYYFQKNSDNPEERYIYLGVRGATNASWTSTISNKVAENLLFLAQRPNFEGFIKNLTSFLEVDSNFILTFDIKDKKLDLKHKKYDEIYEYIDNVVKSYEEKQGYRSDLAKELLKEGLDKYVKFIDYYIKKKPRDLIETNQDCIQLEFSLDTSFKDIFKLIDAYRYMRKIKTLGILGNMTLYLSKGNEYYSFEDSSSGEKHILYLVTSIARYIKDNSIILIDEPEISLHPNWQMQYMHFLRKVFRDYNSCHFIVATHSPYMVSDLLPNVSSLITMKKEGDQRVAELVSYDTYAWSVENILYDVFGTRTVRNIYFETELANLLNGMEELTKDKVKEKKRLLKKLELYIFNDNDPLKSVLEEVRERIEYVESL